jgi:hypothetical protein
MRRSTVLAERRGWPSTELAGLPTPGLAQIRAGVDRPSRTLPYRAEYPGDQLGPRLLRPGIPRRSGLAPLEVCTIVDEACARRQVLVSVPRRHAPMPAPRGVGCGSTPATAWLKAFVDTYTSPQAASTPTRRECAPGHEQASKVDRGGQGRVRLHRRPGSSGFLRRFSVSTSFLCGSWPKLPCNLARRR